MDIFLFVTGIIMVLLFVGFIIAIPLIGARVDTEEEKAKKQLEKVRTQIDERQSYNMSSVSLQEGMNKLSAQLDQIITDNKCIKENYLTIEEQLIKLRHSNQDCLRIEMNRIYYKYLPYKKIAKYDKEAFARMYEDYKDIGGNSYIDTIHEEMKKWKVVESKEDLTK